MAKSESVLRVRWTRTGRVLLWAASALSPACARGARWATPLAWVVIAFARRLKLLDLERA